MLAKLTSKNQITIPKEIISRLPDVQYFDVIYRNGSVVMKPIKVYDMDLDEIRRKMKRLGISDNTVPEAIQWARKK